MLFRSNYLITLASKGTDPGFGGLAGTARSGWTLIGQFSQTQSSWGAWIFVQLSPSGGDTDSSVTGLATGDYRLTTFRVTVT